MFFFKNLTNIQVFGIIFIKLFIEVQNQFHNFALRKKTVKVQTNSF